MIKTTPFKIQEALTDFLIKDGMEFYYFFSRRVTWYQDDSMPTMWAGVKDFRLSCGFNTEFLDSLSLQEVKYLIAHEFSHLIGNHGLRGRGYDHSKANKAMDDIINYMLDKHHGKIMSHPIYTQERYEADMAKNDKMYTALGVKDKVEEFSKKQIGKPMGCVIDPEYVALVDKGERTMLFEDLYEWKEENGKNDKGASFDIHVEYDKLSQDIKDALVHEAVEGAKMDTAQATGRGSTAGCSEELMNLLLKKPKKNNLSLLKRKIAQLKGGIKTRSFRRLNKRVDGIKGNVKQAQAINAGLDVSGSMYGRFDKVISELFKDGFQIDLVQVDTAIHKHQRIKEKKELKKIAIKGLGGTDLQPFVDYVLDRNNGIYGKPSVILTDGDCPSIDFRGSTQQFLILTFREVAISNAPNVKQIIIEDGK